MNPLWGIAGAGGFGGLLAALLTRATGVGLFAKWPAMGDVTAEIAFGIAAALFGVYLLSASDPKNARTLVFAVACGLTWQPVIAGASSYAKQYTSGKAAGGASQAAASLSDQSAPPSPSTVQAAVSATASAVSKLQEITDPEDRSAILNASQSVIENVSKSSTTDPSVKIQALKDIGMASLSSNSPTVSLQAIQPLSALADSKDRATSAAATSALQQLTTEAQRQNRTLVLASPEIRDVRPI
jgi:hypothetical protein